MTVNLLSRPFLKEQSDKTKITEMAQVIEVLQQTEEHWRLMIESATDFAIFNITADGLIESWNVGAERVFGFKESEIIGQQFDILFTPEDRDRAVPQKVLETARQEGRADNGRWQMRRDGSRFFPSGVISPLSGTDKALLKLLAITPNNTKSRKRNLIRGFCINSCRRRKTNENVSSATFMTSSVNN